MRFLAAGLVVLLVVIVLCLSVEDQSNDNSERATVSVSTGQEHLASPPDEGVSFVEDTVSSQGRTVVSADESGPGPSRSGSITSSSNSVRLHIVDAVRQTPLTSVTIVRTWSLDEHPGSFHAEEILASEAASPVELVLPEKGPESLFATAPGFAWLRFELEDTGLREQTIELVSGACVRVEITANDELFEGTRSRPVLVLSGERWSDPEPLRRTVLLMTATSPSDGSSPFTSVLEALGGEEGLLEALLSANSQEPNILTKLELTSPGPTQISGLSPGPCKLSVVLGSMSLVEASVELVAGETALVHLPVGELPFETGQADLSGTFAIPLEWNTEEVLVTLDILGRPDLVPFYETHYILSDLQVDAQGHGHFEFQDMPLGRGMLSVPEFGVVEEVQLVRGGVSGIELTIPEPAEIEMHLSAPEPLDSGPMVWWSPVSTAFVDPSPVYVKLDHVLPTVVRFRAPAGRGIVVCRSGDFEGSRTVDLKPGENSFDLALKRRCQVNLTLIAGKNWLNLDSEFASAVGLSEIDGDGKGCWDREGLSFSVDHAGRYRVEIPAVEGFEIVPPFELDVREEETTSRTIVFTPRQVSPQK